MKYTAINRAHNISKLTDEPDNMRYNKYIRPQITRFKTANSIYFDWLAIRSVTGFGINHYKHPGKGEPITNSNANSNSYSTFRMLTKCQSFST